MKVSVERTPGMRPHPVVQQGQQMLVVLADELEQQVERTRRAHDVVDLGDRARARRRPR